LRPNDGAWRERYGVLQSYWTLPVQQPVMDRVSRKVICLGVLLKKPLSEPTRLQLPAKMPPPVAVKEPLGLMVPE
jgi:hypothetical protein